MLIFFFIDGIGLGKNNPKENPLLENMSFFSKTFGQDCFIDTGKVKTSTLGFSKPVDANLDMQGFPQSATGQSSIFTGVNASKLLGYHLTGVPNKKLRKLINEKSFFKTLSGMGLKTTSANAYSKEYFDKVLEGKLKHSATTLNIIAAEIKFRMIDDLEAGDAVFMDMTNEILKTAYGYDVNKISVEEAASNLLRIAGQNDFTMYEYFLTDLYGHLRGSFDDIKRVLNHIDTFTENLVSGLDLEKHTVVIISDHGNIEDISQKPHTRNPVPLVVFNKRKEVCNHFESKVNSITDIAGCITEYFRLFG